MSSNNSASPQSHCERQYSAKQLAFIFTHHRRLRRIEQFVDANLAEQLHLADVAEAIGVSTSYLSHYFREKTGLRFSEWVRHKRVTQSLVYMHEQELSISEIAHSVGFQNVRSFERAFQKATGETPVHYRKRVFSQNLSRIQS